MIVASVAAVAEDPTITITAPTGHTYEVYQVFTGTVKDDQLVNLKYGENSTKTEGDAVSQADLETLKDLGSAQDARGAAAQTLIDTLEDFVDFTSSPVATVASATATEGLPTGYYVIKDKDDTVPDGDGATLYMFQVLDDNLSIEAKSDKPSSEKKVDDKNDSAPSDAANNKTLVDSADHDIGDTINYTLTFTLPGNYADFEHYYVNFRDTLDAGLTYNGDAKIFYGASDTEGADIDFGTGSNLAYEIMDLKTGTDEQKALTAGSVIKIEYTCTLNENAEIGSTGNKNTYDVEFTRNPNSTGDGTSKPDTTDTPDDTVIVFTYQTVFNKVDEDGNDLQGADFELYKLVDGEYVLVTALHNGDDAVNPTKTLDGTPSTAETKGTAKTFTFAGLDDGQYKLVETVVPKGYNQMTPFEFKIVAEHAETDNDPDADTLTKFEIQDLEGNVISGENLTFTATKNDGKAEADIVNESGVELPSTGGMGTTILYIGGSILVILAAILLITKRRMNAND